MSFEASGQRHTAVRRPPSASDGPTIRLSDRPTHDSLLSIPASRLTIPASRFPIPDSQFPNPNSPIPNPKSPIPNPRPQPTDQRSASPPPPIG